LANDGSVPIGVLHSTSGTMALNETSLRDVILMEVARVNEAGGLLGRPIAPVVLDPASDWALYRDMASRMIHDHEVVAIFGCWTSASRKCVLPVVEQADRLLFYPLQYEGEEQSPNVFYLGAAPNQQAIPALEYLMSAAGGGFSRFFFVGTDYVYPRTTNRVLRSFLEAKGLAIGGMPELYVPFGHTDWRAEVEALQRFRAGGRGVIISTINGDSNLSFYQAVRNTGFAVDDLPIMAFSVSEAELQSLDPDDVAGHYACWDYFMSNPAPQNRAFLENWRRFSGDERPAYAPMAGAVLGFRLWCRAVAAAGTTATAAVRQYMLGQSEVALNGRTAVMGVNHHIDMVASVGRATRNRQFQIVWSTKRPIPGDPWAADSIIADTTASHAQRDVLDALPNPLIVLDERGDVRYRSLSTHTYFGDSIKPRVLKRLQEVTRAAKPASVETGADRLPEITVRDTDGRTRHMTITTGRMVFAGEPAHLLSLADVTDIRRIEDQLRLLNGKLQQLANTDPLTGVNNRRYFINAVTTGLKEMHRQGREAALFFLDIDHFKSLNDRFGHQVGDHALVQVATTAHRLMRASDVFARIGGEEFAGFLPETCIDSGMQIAERLRAAVAALPLRVGNQVTGLTCSIGVASVDAEIDTAELAMKHADAALYVAKQEGRNRVHRH
jgi:urea transport system substrate-binding protein